MCVCCNITKSAIVTDGNRGLAIVSVHRTVVHIYSHHECRKPKQFRFEPIAIKIQPIVDHVLPNSHHLSSPSAADRNVELFSFLWAMFGFKAMAHNQWPEFFFSTWSWFDTWCCVRGLTAKLFVTDSTVMTWQINGGKMHLIKQQMCDKGHQSNV